MGDWRDRRGKGAFQDLRKRRLRRWSERRGATGRAGDEIAGKWRRPAGGCIWSPSARCSYRPRPRLVFACWRGDRGKLLHAAHPRWPILSHDEAGLIPGRVLIGRRGREHLRGAFDRLREEQRGQVSRACWANENNECSIGTEIPLVSCMTPACIMYASYTSCRQQIFFCSLAHAAESCTNHVTLV